MEYSSDSELSDSDRELQEAFAEGKLKPGLNTVQEVPKKRVNNVEGLKQKLVEISLDLPWLEKLDSVNEQAPLAPELAAQLLMHEEKRENQFKNNKKLVQLKPHEDPVLNDFKREMLFQRQAQAAVLEAIPKLKALGLPTKRQAIRSAIVIVSHVLFLFFRPDDYFAEMAKTDEHMQKIREHLMKKQQQQQRSERVKQLRQQKKEGKMMQIQTKLQREQEKKEMLDQVKKYRKGASKDLDFLDSKKSKSISRKSLEKRKMKNKKFGFGGKKKGLKRNTNDSAADISEYRRPKPTKKTKDAKGKVRGE
ncbi:hypothetical protein D910_06207 [Dendroctonus ponderosae]|uniref:Uncharacterized protein n=1 Tax=Dendroctonus ponderosae TaxID=77166 RepID=U4UG01_DENPD|nr:hypothetical protein D910_06207 [Dendroctonus ponderosae]